MSGSNVLTTKSGYQTKRGSFSRFMMTSALVAVGSFGFIPAAHAVDIELPVLGGVTDGAATFANPTIDKLDINQSTDRVIINWNKFNIGTDATVQFYQPGADSLAVNKVTDSGTFTRIDGKLKANGNVVILDPNGVIFGAGSTTDVNGIIASTGSLDNDAEVMGGSSILKLKNIGSTAGVINRGAITASGSGLTALVGSTVENHGVIQATLGKVALAAGNTTATIDLFGDGLVELAVEDNAGATEVKNTGTVEARTVLMTASSAKKVVDGIVNTSGVVNASTARVVGGKIILSAGTVEVKRNAQVTGNTNIKAKTTKLGATINGTLTGAAGTVYVTNDTAKIMQAMDIIEENGTVDVAAGTYYEDVIVSKNGVYLKGAQSGVLGFGGSRTGPDGEILISSFLEFPVKPIQTESIIKPSSPGVQVMANNVTVDGFTIDGANNGIEVKGFSFATLINNIISNSAIATGSEYTENNGIYLVNASDAIIRGNHIYNVGDSKVAYATDPTPVLHGSGVRSDYSSNILIDNNIIENAEWDGVKINGGYNLTVQNNGFYNLDRVGIYSDGASKVEAYNNSISGIGMYGIRFVSGENHKIVGNNIGTIAGGENPAPKTAYEGISLNFATGQNLIDGNSVDFTAGHGIHVIQSTATTISGNRVGTSGVNNNINGDDILVEKSSFVQVLRNILSEATSTAFNIGSGVHISNSDDVHVADNIISETEWDGVKVTNGTNVSVTGNQIDEVARVGVYANGTKNITASSNNITDADIHGIRVINVDTADISYNNIDRIVREGIAVLYSTGAKTIVGNNVNNTGLGGIYTTYSGDALIKGNSVGASGGSNNIKGDGIYVQYSTGNQIIDNIIRNTTEDGINVYTSGVSRIDNNNIQNVGVDGINLYSLTADEGGVSVTGNKIYGVGNDGIDIDGRNPITYTILNNEINNANEDNVFAEDGLRLDLGAEGTVVLAGNNIGSNFNYGIYGISGIFDLTGATNTIHDTKIGMAFVPDHNKWELPEEGDILAYLGQKLKLVGDTIGTTAFVDQTEAFIALGYGAFFEPGMPTVLDGMNATYTIGGTTIAPSVLGYVTPAEQAALESMIYHYLDVNDRGLFFFTPQPVPEVLAPATIDNSDVFSNFPGFTPRTGNGSLIITGLPSVNAGNPSLPNNGPILNFNDIAPAAGEEENTQTAEGAAAVAPAAGGDGANNSSCWSDATQSLGQGTAVQLNLGSSANQMLQDAANCGNENDQAI